MDVVCLGMLIADIFGSPIDSMPAAGELRSVDRYLMSAGGCASNTAACLRRLGHKVSIIGKVGNDILGDFVVNDLKRLGVDASAVKRSSSNPTSNTYIINVRGEDRRYLHCVGANADFHLSDVDFKVLDGRQALYVGGYMMMPGFGPEALASVLKEAKARSLMTVVDVVIGGGTHPSWDQVEGVFPWIDVFLPNNDEAKLLTGKDDPLEQAAALGSLNSKCTVVITLGRHGVLVRTENKTLSAPAYKVVSIDESGAGDAFAAGFITSMLENWNLEKTLSFASAVGASCTRSLGCTDGVFLFEEAMNFIAKNKLDFALA
jgi:sugar/nucleoside kinase (ribokinase family)